ncbi:MAG: HAD family hydrolase [Cyanobacteria bacterium J06638_22]
MQHDWSQWTLANPIRLVATDMDGTLTHRGKFTPILFEALERLASVNIPVIIVTGRSAGWVEAIAHYLPIAGAIAENGGLYFAKPDSAPDILVPIADLPPHRQQLANAFHVLQQTFPHLREASDNRFRLTDWTFGVQGLSPIDLQWMRETCQEEGWGFTYSTVQCHIKLPQQEKATALQAVLQRYFPDLELKEIVTVGDSPNDESLFNPAIFPNAFGVANVREYGDRLTYVPRILTPSPEVQGFLELARQLQTFSQP